MMQTVPVLVPGRHIGVTGIRGYIPDEKASHIMARHVSVADGATVT